MFLDLEDAVAPSEKEQARKNVIEALRDIDWAGKGKIVSVRINGLDTHYMYRDVVDVVEQSGDRLHTILVPKVGLPPTSTPWTHSSARSSRRWASPIVSGPRR